MTLAVLTEFVLNGLVLGALYVLMALGLSIIFGMIGVINFAHGALFTLGAYVAFQVKDALGFPATLVVSPVLVGVLGMLIEATLLRRLYREDPLQGLLLTFGLTMVLELGNRVRGVRGRAVGAARRRPAYDGRERRHGGVRRRHDRGALQLLGRDPLGAARRPGREPQHLLPAARGRGVDVHPHGRHPPAPAARPHGRALGKIRVTRVLRHPLTWLSLWFLVLPLLMGAVQSTVSLATEIVIFSLLAIAYNLLMGYTGLVSFGHSAFFVIGGYAAGLAQLHLARGMVVPLVVGVLGATLAGAGIGFLLMRKRGVYFSLLTLAFTQMFFYLVYGATAVTGGENGLGGIERFPLAAGPLRLDLGDKRAYYYATAVLAAGAIFLLWRVVHSPFGRVLEAIRENEARASFVGYDVKRYKLTAFVVSCAFSGLAGTLYTFLLNFAYPESLHVTLAGEIAAMTLVGGMRSFVGPAVA